MTAGKVFGYSSFLEAVMRWDLRQARQLSPREAWIRGIGGAIQTTAFAFAAAGTLHAATSSSSSASSQVFHVTPDGVVLPTGARVPRHFVENPYRTGSYGIMKNGKFVEKLRIDPGTAVGMKGPNYSHLHINGSKAHTTEWPY